MKYCVRIPVPGGGEATFDFGFESEASARGWAIEWARRYSIDPQRISVYPSIESAAQLALRYLAQDELPGPCKTAMRAVDRVVLHSFPGGWTDVPADECPVCALRAAIAKGKG
jgi:hypothetical protein